MSITIPTTNTAMSLEAIAAALVTANQALERHADPATASAAQDQTVRESLIAIACAACDAVTSWDAATALAASPVHVASSPAAAGVPSWRGQLDELRVQAALAEMELRDSSHHTLAAVEQVVVETERRIAGGLRDIGGALAAFRIELKKRLP